MKLILASASPRRYEILAGLGYDVCRLPTDIDETPYVNELPMDYVRRLAVEKNRVAVRDVQSAGCPVVSADTSVVLDTHILGKPESPEQAVQMLRQLSGREHEVLTGICVSFEGQECACVQVNKVLFKCLTEQEIAAYVATGEPMDKAGAYGIQGLAGMFVAHLSGSFTGVMGLPVFETVDLLRQCGVATPV